MGSETLMFRFNRLDQQQASDAFAGISDSLARAAKSVISIAAYEADEKKAHDATQVELDKVFGTVEATGQGMDQYKKMVENQQAEAQRIGAIKAYDTSLNSAEKAYVVELNKMYKSEGENMNKLMTQIGTSQKRIGAAVSSIDTLRTQISKFNAGEVNKRSAVMAATNANLAAQRARDKDALRYQMSNKQVGDMGYAISQMGYGDGSILGEAINAVADNPNIKMLQNNMKGFNTTMQHRGKDWANWIVGLDSPEERTIALNNLKLLATSGYVVGNPAELKILNSPLRTNVNFVERLKAGDYGTSDMRKMGIVPSADLFKQIGDDTFAKYGTSQWKMVEAMGTVQFMSLMNSLGTQAMAAQKQAIQDSKR